MATEAVVQAVTTAADEALFWQPTAARRQTQQFGVRHQSRLAVFQQMHVTEQPQCEGIVAVWGLCQDGCRGLCTDGHLSKLSAA